MKEFPCTICGDPVVFSPESVADEWFDPDYVRCQECQLNEAEAA
jgi:DNA-directed RNA polymerase subunit RPC12/RpoP